MNINDVYITKVYTVDRIDYLPHFETNHHATYTRTTIVLRKEVTGSVKFYDLMKDKYIKHDMYYCDIGEEVIGIEKMYVNLVDAIGYKGRNHVSKRKVKQIVKKKAKEVSKNNEHL